jgi:hypothetical protein
MSTPTPPAQSAEKPKAPSASSPESLDSIIVTTKPHAWWALWAITGAVILVFIWSLVATIPIQTSATGIINGYKYNQIITALAAGVFESNIDITAPKTLASTIPAGTIFGKITPYDGGPPVDVKTTVAGRITSIFVMQGAGVEVGEKLAELMQAPNPSQGMSITAYVPESTAFALDVGATADVTVTDVESGQTAVVPGTILSIGTVPASLDSMTTVTGSPSLSQQWSDEAGGMPYRVDLALSLAQWSPDIPLPKPGVIVSIVYTSAELHPIQLLFGGG